MNHRRPSVLILVATAALVGCNTTESDWKRAHDANTLQAYTEFVAKHSHGAHTNEASAAIESMEWDSAGKANTISAYKDFLGKFPNATTAETARKCLVDLQWADAKQTNTKQGYASFVQMYPSSTYAPEAHARIAALGIMKAGSVTIYEGMGSSTCSGSFSARIGTDGSLGHVRDEVSIRVVDFRAPRYQLDALVRGALPADRAA